MIASPAWKQLFELVFDPVGVPSWKQLSLPVFDFEDVPVSIREALPVVLSPLVLETEVLKKIDLVVAVALAVGPQSLNYVIVHFAVKVYPTYVPQVSSESDPSSHEDQHDVWFFSCPQHVLDLHPLYAFFHVVPC